VDVPVLLTNHQFRRRLLAGVSDPLVLAPFFAWFDSLSDAERSQVIAPVLNKTRAFLSRTSIRHLLGQAEPRFQLDELFTRASIVIVNLNRGELGQGTAELIGSLLMSQLWQAILRRAAVPAGQRKPVMLVVDEVQDYLRLPVDLGEMLAQARGLGVSLTMAHQHLGQLGTKLRAGLTANARSKVVFRPSHDDADALAAMLGANLTGTDLQRLGAHEACIRLLHGSAPVAPFSVGTPLLGPAMADVDELRTASLERYGREGRQLDAELVGRWETAPAEQGDEVVGASPRSAS
jgi:hypothetical protein